MPEDFGNITETELGLQGFFFFSHPCLVAVGHKVGYLHCSKLRVSKSRLQIGITCRAFQIHEMQALHHTPYSRSPLGSGSRQRDVGSTPRDPTMKTEVGDHNWGWRLACVTVTCRQVWSLQCSVH